MNENILRFDDPPENQNGGEEDILYFDDVKDNQDDEDILYFDDIEVDEKQPPVEKLTLEDWNLSEEDFKADKSGKLARLYPEFDFQESGIDDQITVTNKRTGNSDYFDLGSTDGYFLDSDFEQFNEWIANERANMPELNEDQERIYNRTGLIKNPAVTGFLGGEIQPAGYGDIQVRYSPTSNASRDANEKELSEVMDVLDSLQEEAFFNPYKYGIGLEDSPGILKLDYENDQHRKVKDKIINTVKETTGVDITNDSFDYLYNKLAAKNKTKVDREYEKRKVNIEGELNPVFEMEFGEEADEGKEEYQLNIEGFNAQQFKITQELSEVENKIKQANNNTEIDEKQLAAQISSLQKQKTDLNNLYNRFEDLKKEEAKKIPGYAGTGRLYTGISNKELTTSFFNNKGYSKESVNKLAELAEDTDNSAAAAAQTVINQNPGISQREAVKELYDNELLYLQNFQKEGREKFVTLDISEAKKGGFKEGLLSDAWQIIKKYPSKYEDLGGDKIKISYEALREMGVDSRKFEGWYDSMIGMADDKTIESIKAYNQEIDESTTIARSYRNLWRNNVDVGAVEKPGFFRNLFQGAGASTLTWGGLNEKEAKEFLTGTKDGFQRDRIDNLNNAIAIANSSLEITKTMGGKIELTKEQKENIDKTMSEEISSGVGYFIPDLMVLGFTGGTMNALGYAKLMQKLSPLMRFAVGATVEEAKMQTILDMKPGGGAAFYTLGQATSGLTFFKGRAKWLEPLFQKVIKQGPIGATSAEFAQVSELGYESLMGDKNFKEEFDKLYGDFDEVTRRFIVNNVVFAMTGVFHIAEGDFTTTRGKYKAIAKLQEARDALMQLPKDLQPAVDRAEGVSIPDAAKPKKTYDDLTSSEKAKFNEYNERILRLSQQVQLETMSTKLNPNSKNFEKDFDNIVTKPMNKAIQSVVPEFEGVKVNFGRGKEFRRKNFDTNAEGKDLGNTAQYNPNTKEMYFDLDFYTTGKPVHEFTHAAINSYFDANPNAKRNFTKRMGTIFKDFDFGQYEGTELEAKIKEAYNIDLRTWKGKNLAAEEYLAFMSEFLADPKVYYTNTDLASNFMKEFRLEVKDIMIESGLKTPTPKTAKDMVQLMALLGKSTRMGTKLDVKASQLAKLEEIDILGTEIIEGNRKAVTQETRASKEITDENRNIVDRLKEAKEKEDTQAETDAKNDLLINNQGLINEFVNTKFVPDLGISKEEFKSGVQLHVLDKVNKTYNPEANPEYGAYLREVLFGGGKFGGGRLGNILKELGQQGDLFTRSTEDVTVQKELKTITDEPTKTEVSKKKAIVVSDRLGSSADKVVSKIKKKISTKDFGKEFLEKQTYKSLKDLASEETQLMFGIKPKPGNLTKSDVKNAQIFINKDPDLFISLLPKQHTTKRVKTNKKDSQGNFIYETRPDKATGVQNVLLDAFYNKGTRKDNLTPYTKKSNIKVSDFLEVMGITERGEPNLYRKDSNVSARIKALVEQTGRIITNQTVREVFPNLPSTVAEGKSPPLASKKLDPKKFEKIALDPIGNFAKSAAAILKKAGIERLKFGTKEGVHDPETERVMKNFVEEIMPKYFPMKKIAGSGALVNNSKGIGMSMTGDNRTVSVRKGRSNESHGLSETQVKQLEQFATNVGGIWNKFMSGDMKALESADHIKKMKDNYAGLDLFIDQMQKMIEAEKYNPEVIQAIEAYFRTSSASSSHPMRMGSFAMGGEINWKGDKGPEREHVIPANQLGEIIFRTLLDPKVNVKNLKKLIKENYFQILINKYNDGKLRAAGLGSTMPEGYWKSWQEAIKTGDFSIAQKAWVRYFNPKVNAQAAKINGVTTYGFNPNEIILLNKKGKLESLADQLQIGEKEFGRDVLNPEVIAKQQNLIYEWARRTDGFKETNQLREKMAIELDMLNAKRNATLETMKDIAEIKNPIFNMSERMTNKILLNKASKFDKALDNARKIDKPTKKARVFDFDDTVARTNSKVFAERAGERKVLTAEEFAKQGEDLVSEGWKMDFSDFNRVVEGKKGPLFEVMKKMKEAAGERDLFILTARAPESAPAIKQFLDAMGIKIPLENITGLGNSTGKAKADWLVEKASEGYNDFYFADDAPQNVKAVRDAMSVLDVKSKVQQAYASKDLSKEFNNVLEQTTGVEAYKEYSAAKAKVVGASKGKGKFWIPYSAEDFQGLIYKTLGKGKLGDKQMAWYKENLLNPYARAMDNLSKDRVQLMSDFKELKKQLDVPKDLRKKNASGFTNEQAVRVYLYDKMGHEAPGLSKTDLRELTDIVNSDGKLKAFADQILTVTKGDGYVKPGENWLVGTITTDLIDLLNTTKRKKYLEQWQSNVDQIYSKENLNKLESIYGSKYREALQNSLARMKSGKNRLTTGNRLSNQMLDYINGSNAAIMFFNTRSAVLQTISAINFVNWSFNNPYKAGKAFANQKQYWKDFTKLMNSDFLVDRRNGLRLNIAESEIADAAATSKNKVKGAIKYILEKGYLPTQYADSFAIASGGATWYRNRINDLVKKGVKLNEAEKQALTEWRQIAEESQQSSDPSKISEQQASDAGRLILMFANTPMQYARLQKRAFQDLINGRGDAKTNVSKIIYYAFVQNMLFNALQQAMFKLGFDDEEDDAEKNKTYFRTANGMLDSQLRGIGIAGAAVSVGKNFLLDIYERSKRSRPEYVDSMWKFLQFSPPISSKISRLRQAAYAFDSKKRREEIFEKGFSLDNPALMAGAKTISATTNIPLDRVLQKYYNIEASMSDNADWWQTLAMISGWPEWSIMDDKDENKSKTTKRKSSSRKRKRVFN